MPPVQKKVRAPEIRAVAEERHGIGQRLRQARRRADLTLEKVGEMVGVVRESVSQWEAGRNYPTPDRLRKLARLYGVSVDWLLEGEIKKRIGETPGAYFTGEPPPTDEEMNLAMEFIRFLREQVRRERERRRGDGSGEQS